MPQIARLRRGLTAIPLPPGSARPFGLPHTTRDRRKASQPRPSEAPAADGGPGIIASSDRL